MKKLLLPELAIFSIVFLSSHSVLTPAHAQSCSWVGVENAGINSHQPGQPWCSPGSFLVALDLDGPRNLSPYDSPVVGQAQCCQAVPGSPLWGGFTWVGVENAGINSHQPGQPWCSPGSFLVALDLDGPRNYSPHDSPVVGQAMCSSPAVNNPTWNNCRWVSVANAGINSHQPGPSWCPAGSFLVALDLDGPRNFAAHDTPIVGQARCCSP